MCESCAFADFDQELEEWICTIQSMMDEDDYGKMNYGHKKGCTFYRVGDEYSIVRKQN